MHACVQGKQTNKQVYSKISAAHMRPHPGQKKTLKWRRCCFCFQRRANRINASGGEREETACGGHFDTRIQYSLNLLPEMETHHALYLRDLAADIWSKKEEKVQVKRSKKKRRQDMLQPNSTWHHRFLLASASWAWSLPQLIMLCSFIPLSCFLLVSFLSPPFLSFFYSFLEKVDLIQTEPNCEALW